MKRILIAILFFNSFTCAETGKITNTEVINQTGVYCPYAEMDGHRHCFRQSQSIRVTVQLGNMKYSAEYGVGWASGLIVGDPIEATVKKNKLILTNPSGKTAKKNVVRREHVTY
jgi:hypothetical protein